MDEVQVVLTEVLGVRSWMEMYEEGGGDGSCKGED